MMKRKKSEAQQAIVETIAEVQLGKFIPDRERDELTKALKNPEKGGRTRGFGPDVAWKIGLPGDHESYRSRARAKKRKEPEEEDWLNNLERANEEILAMVAR